MCAAVVSEEYYIISGGVTVRIKDYARILFVLGMGMAPVLNVTVPTASGTSVWQNTVYTDREIVFSLVFDGTLDQIRTKRAALINAVRPDKTSPKQALTIRYQGLGANGAAATGTADISAHYVDGLGSGPQIPGIERAQVRFMSYQPFIQNTTDSSVNLGFSSSVANFANIGYRDTDGTWHAIGTGAAGGQVETIVLGPDNDLYIGGAFTSLNGVANTSRICKYDPDTGTVSALGTGAANGRVTALAFGTDGKLYAGGSFTGMGGVANTEQIAYWSSGAWHALGTGGANNVNALAVNPTTGLIYIGGDFTTIGGVTANRIASWNGSTFAALGTGMEGLTDSVHALAYGWGHLYAGGNFEQAGQGGSHVIVDHIAYWDDTAWNAMPGGGVDSSLSTPYVYALAVTPMGLAVGGSFDIAKTTTLPSGVTCSNVIIWNGTKINTMNGGVENTVFSLQYVDGATYLSGLFVTAGGNPVPDRMAIYTNGGIFLPLDVNLQDNNADIETVAVDSAGRLYIGGLWTGTTALSATTTASAGTIPGYPTVTFTGPGTLWQLKNYTTGAAIYFKNLTLSAGEVATLTLDPASRGFTSTTRGDLMGYIANGSTMDWKLQSGTNNISCFMTGTTGASSAVMTWRAQYESTDDVP